MPAAATLIVALGLAPLLWLEHGPSPGLLVRSLLRVLALVQIYLVWHLLFAGIAPAAAEAPQPLIFWVMAVFTLLYVLQVWLRRHPQGRLARTLFPWAYCGFYLDETFTRLTFKFWPARLNGVQAQTRVNRHLASSGEAA